MELRALNQPPFWGGGDGKGNECCEGGEGGEGEVGIVGRYPELASPIFL